MVPLLNEADAVLLGTTPADAIYVGEEKVWPSRAPRYNLIKNPSWEVDLTGVWSGPQYPCSGSGGGVAPTKARELGGVSGAGSYCLSLSGGTGARYVQINADYFIDQDKPHTFSFYAKTSLGYQELSYVDCYTSASEQWIISGTWERYSVVIPPQEWWDKIEVGWGAPPSGTLWVDGVMLEEGETAGPYFDGSTPDGDGWEYSWAGTPHNSASIATPV